MNFPLIITDPEVCGGKPVIRGTRIMVKNILGLVAGGYDRVRIREAYPQLSNEDISEALAYAAQIVEEDQVFAHA